MKLNYNTIKIIRSLTPKFALDLFRRYRKNKLIKKWIIDGKPIPPPHHIKQEKIRSLQKEFEYDLFIETGTYLGEMVEAQKKYFKKIISIELSEEIFINAKKRFRNDRHVKIIQGDSGVVLHGILKDIDSPAIFWLDGHYSSGKTALGKKECPIFEEVDAIFKEQKFKHVILIDDARYFKGEGDYPTIEELTNYIQKKNNKYTMECKDDMICYTPS